MFFRPSSSLPCLSLFFPILFNSLVLSDLLYLLFPFLFPTLFIKFLFLTALARCFLIHRWYRRFVTTWNLELILFILVVIPRALSSLFFSTLLAFILPIFSNSLVSPYRLHSVGFFPFSCLLCLCIFLTALAWRFLSNSWYRSCCERIDSWINSANFGSDTSCSFFPLLFYSACLYSSLFFSTPGALLSSGFYWLVPFLFSTLFR